MNEISIKAIRKILPVLFYCGLVLLGIYILVKLSFLFAPFIIAAVISSLIEPLIRFITKKTGFSRKTASLFAILLTIFWTGMFLFFVISRLVSEAYNVYNSLPEYYSRIYDSLSIIMNKFEDISNVPPQDTNSLASSLSSAFTKALDYIIRIILNTAISLPDAIIFLSVTILSTYFLSSDRDKILGIACRLTPQSFLPGIQRIKNEMFSALFGYIKAQLILMSITFSELCIGLSFIGIKSPFLISLIISLIDALPILGTGAILIPWSLYYIITGDFRLAVSIVIIYSIVLIVRQLVEPRILSRQIGVHPLLTLLGIYIGLNLFGVAGLILGPITVLLFKSIISGRLIGRETELLVPSKKNTR